MRITDRIFSRLAPSDFEQLDPQLPDIQETAIANIYRNAKGAKHWKPVALRLMTHYVPSSREKTHLQTVRPPKGIHFLQRKDPLFVGDLYSSNMVGDCLEKVGIDFEPGNSYLDFGCSSGVMLRALAAYEPDAKWFGADPNEKAIEWATEALPHISFLKSDQNPPLNYEADTFTGVTAISIWSHFSERAALAWFDEMARIIKKGGWLFFTTHGEVTPHIYAKMDRRKGHEVDTILKEMYEKTYHFEGLGMDVNKHGLTMSDWGNAYILRSWFEANLTDKWDIVYFEQARNQHNQDAYILRLK